MCDTYTKSICDGLEFYMLLQVDILRFQVDRKGSVLVGDIYAHSRCSTPDKRQHQTTPFYRSKRVFTGKYSPEKVLTLHALCADYTFIIVTYGGLHNLCIHSTHILIEERLLSCNHRILKTTRVVINSWKCSPGSSACARYVQPHNTYPVCIYVRNNYGINSSFREIHYNSILTTTKHFLLMIHPRCIVCSKRTILHPATEFIYVRYGRVHLYDYEPFLIRV
jgi:hypothetical protein